MPGAERSHVVESAKPGKPPPAEPREARREGAGGAQRRATRSAAGGHDPPLDTKPAGGNATFPQNLPAERVLPAPRAGERTLSAFFHWLHPLRPTPGTVRSRPARGRFFALPRYNHRAPCLQKLPFPAPRERYPKNFFCPFPAAGHNDSSASRPARVPRNHFPRYNPRALLEIKDDRSRYTNTLFQLPHFRSPRRFCNRPRPAKEATFPAPASKSRGGGVGHSLGEGFPLPEGRTFRIPFPSLGKVSPARGAHNKQFLIAKNQK